MNKFGEKKNSLIAEAEKLITTAENEVRVFTEAETKRYNEIMTEAAALNEQIEQRAKFTEMQLKNKSKDSENNEETEKEKKEERAFTEYLRGAVLGDKVSENRANMTYGDNGAVIPKTIINKIIDKVTNISPIFASATKYTVKGDISIPYVNTASGDITVAFANEFSTLTASSVKISSIELKGFLAGSLVVVSKRLINNSQFDILSFVINRMAEKIAVFIENYLINGDTVNGGAKSGLKNSVTQKVEITEAGKLSADDLIDIQDTIPDVYQANAYWIMNPKTRTAIRKLKDGQNNYLLIKDFASPTGYTLLGKPVYVSDNIKGVDTASNNDDIIYYGDFSGLAVKVGEGAEIQVLNEVYATQHATGLVAWLELDNTVEAPQKIVKASVASEAA